MFVIKFIILAISAIVFFYLVFSFLIVVMSLFRKEKLQVIHEGVDFDYACIITAYKNADITKPLVQSLLNQKYANFMVYLIADNCDVSNWDITHEKLVVIRPEPPLNLKVKSIIHAFENFKRKHDYAVIFDGDNLAHPDFLRVINKYARAGHKVIQGQRRAKNLNSMYACADATGEFYKNFVDRYVPYKIGSSSVISGSGMAVEHELYWQHLTSPEIEEGKHKSKKMLQEDKILQNFVVGHNNRIVYAFDAIVYDEKVDSAQQVETQRSRWLYSYFQNIPFSSKLLFDGITKFRWNQWVFGVITTIPPMFILLATGMFLTVVNFFIHPIYAAIMALGCCIFVGNIFLSLYLYKVPPQIWKTIWSLPFFVFNQIKGLFKMGNPNKNFTATEHNHNVSIDEVLKTSDKEGL